jgi:hypothetical protein
MNYSAMAVCVGLRIQSQVAKYDSMIKSVALFSHALIREISAQVQVQVLAVAACLISSTSRVMHVHIA